MPGSTTITGISTFKNDAKRSPLRAVGKLAPSAVEEVPRRVLKEQLGAFFDEEVAAIKAKRKSDTADAKQKTAEQKSGKPESKGPKSGGPKPWAPISQEQKPTGEKPTRRRRNENHRRDA